MLAAFSTGCGPKGTPPEQRAASTHPMRYFISLPPNWSKDRTWPVVIAGAGSGKEWTHNATVYAAERDKRKYPFITITPVAVTLGAYRHDTRWPYDSVAWGLIEREGRCKFDIDGIRAIMADVAANFSGEPKAFITGFSGGGQLPIALALLHPEQFRVAMSHDGHREQRRRLHADADFHKPGASDIPGEDLQRRGRPGEPFPARATRHAPVVVQAEWIQ
jgi:poly(3-hydroxybutyrate) depolymerase